MKRLAILACEYIQWLDFGSFQELPCSSCKYCGKLQCISMPLTAMMGKHDWSSQAGPAHQPTHLPRLLNLSPCYPLHLPSCLSAFTEGRCTGPGHGLFSGPVEATDLHCSFPPKAASLTRLQTSHHPPQASFLPSNISTSPSSPSTQPPQLKRQPLQAWPCFFLI